ncbi:hypothetical protein D9Q98_008320 [Chlorella vulgaris]|uniref:Ribosomal protein n=1 Tax=Chlorella vulgaris TaxID=3077 RepID=A0A9D4TGH0_CHLVU|nr:hypothetical protein D9Q98_008320 [Chlorella vulgaris]
MALTAARRGSSLLLGRYLCASQGACAADTAHVQCMSSAATAASSSSSSSSQAPDAAATAAAAAAAAPAWAARSGIKTLDGLPMPSWIVSTPKPKRPQMGLQEAIEEVQSLAAAKFDESVEIAIRLGIDPRRGDQMVRGAATLPHGTGKSVRVCVFAKDEAADAARAAGAEVVGDDDLIAQILESGGGGLQFDKCIATPDMMPRLSRVARILGPRGLMPNPKMGTVTPNVVAAVQTMKQGRVEYRADKGGVVHAGLGKCSFSAAALLDNAGAFTSAILAARPKGVKGGTITGYLLSASLSSTMGPGIPLSVASLVATAQATKAKLE